MCSQENIQLAVRRFLADELGKDSRDVQDSDSLLEAGVIDSIGIMRLVAFLESAYDFTADDEDLVPENFDSLTAIAAYVAGRKGIGD